ncbi:MAG: DMT family transporter [Acidobacteria bacterium]|nr:DMT family transporter [Acidobacteriota bacterium]
MSGAGQYSVGRGRAELALVVVALIWGSAFVVVKEALADVSTFAFLGLRFAIAAVLLAVVLRKHLGRARVAEWKGGMVCSGLLFLGFALQTAGLRVTTASKSAFLTGLYIVLVPLLGSFVKRSRPRWMELAGAVLATAGTALMTSGGLDAHLNLGDAMTAGCAVAFAAHLLAVEHYSRKMDYERLSLYQVAGVALLSGLAAGSVETPRVVWTTALWIGLITTAVLATALSFALYTWAQKHTSATKAVLILALEPVFAGLVAWALIGEDWSVGSLGGAALIVAGIVLAELKPAQPKLHPVE